MFLTGILTISDRSSRGERADESGQVAQRYLEGLSKFQITKYEIVPDEVLQISQILKKWVDTDKLDFIVTSGGTGLAPRDVTPEATMSVIEKVIPGIAEAIRMDTKKKAPSSILSRAVAGSRGKCLIINLPGSPVAVKECLEVVINVVPHALETLTGKVFEGPHNIGSM
jgi:molybdopterin adenylyltransferase